MKENPQPAEVEVTCSLCGNTFTALAGSMQATGSKPLCTECFGKDMREKLLKPRRDN